jgi:hypothetical protein
VYARSASTVTSKFQDGTDFTPLGAIAPISGLGWSDTMPGDPDTHKCTVQVSPGLVQPQALDAGRIVEVWRGGIAQWEGVLDQPSPADGAWSVTAKGAGTYGDAYRDIWTTWTDVNDPLAAAVARGLRWKLTTSPTHTLYPVDRRHPAPRRSPTG